MPTCCRARERTLAMSRLLRDHIVPTRRRPIASALCIHAFADSDAFGRTLARHLHAPARTVDLHRFPDGESIVRVHAPVGTHAVVVRSLHDPNAKLVETVLAADALRRAGARRVTLVAPYLPYMRQDAVFTPGEPVSQRVIGAWLGRAFDAVLTIEAHLHRVPTLAAVVPGRAQSLSAAPALADWLRRLRTGAIVVGPDGESKPWIQAIARRARLPWVVCAKQRLGDRSVRVQLPALPGCRRAVIIDDIASSGATLAGVARALRAAGVATIDAIIVHAIFSPGALPRIRRAGVQRILSCDTIVHPTNAIPTAGILAPVIRRTFS
jgi:ribose-phosphate pyrophosphokinase